MKRDREPCRKFHTWRIDNHGEIYDKCCGIDVHKKLIVACFKTGRKREIKKFGAATQELLFLADWLIAHIKNLDCEIDDRMNPEQKEVAERISQMPGFGDVSAKAVISVIGTDMSRFPTDSHIASWSGLCPGNNESAHKRKSGKTRKGNALLRSTLVNAVHSATRNKTSFFYAQFKRISAHRGKKRAYVAVAHSMLVVGGKINLPPPR